MGRQYWASPVGPFNVTDGTAVANSTTLTDASAAPQIVLPAGQLELGTEIEIDAFGTFSTTGTPTLLLGFYYGGVAGVALAATTAITTGTATNWPVVMYYRGVVRSVGSAGSINGQGNIKLGTSLTALTLRAIPETFALRTVAIDTTTAKAITVGAQWGTASASNTFTLNDISVRLCN
jgi:hypothetical protein